MVMFIRNVAIADIATTATINPVLAVMGAPFIRLDTSGVTHNCITNASNTSGVTLSMNICANDA
jgi:hypothetical protein